MCGRVPLLYGLQFYKSRDELREVRLLEVTLEADYELAKLTAEGSDYPAEAKAIMESAEAEHETMLKEIKELRSALPTTIRKLTAGCNAPRGPRIERCHPLDSRGNSD